MTPPDSAHSPLGRSKGRISLWTTAKRRKRQAPSADSARPPNRRNRCGLRGYGTAVANYAPRPDPAGGIGWSASAKGRLFVYVLKTPSCGLRTSPAAISGASPNSAHAETGLRTPQIVGIGLEEWSSQVRREFGFAPTCSKRRDQVCTGSRNVSTTFRTAFFCSSPSCCHLR